MLRAAIFIALTACSTTSSHGIPDRYARDIANLIHESEAVIVYRVTSVSLESTLGPIHSYRLDTTTVEALKGSPPPGACYMIHSEGKLTNAPKVGDTRIVVLAVSYSDCGVIEPGLGAPATDGYLQLYKTILESNRPNNVLKPTPHRGANHMAGKACHVLHAPLRRGLA